MTIGYRSPRTPLIKQSISTIISNHGERDANGQIEQKATIAHTRTHEHTDTIPLGCAFFAGSISFLLIYSTPRKTRPFCRGKRRTCAPSYFLRNVHTTAFTARIMSRTVVNRSSANISRHHGSQAGGVCICNIIKVARCDSLSLARCSRSIPRPHTPADLEQPVIEGQSS